LCLTQSEGRFNPQHGVSEIAFEISDLLIIETAISDSDFVAFALAPC